MSCLILCVLSSAAVDIDQISRNVDVQMLQDNVEHVAFCDIDSELVRSQSY